MSTHTPFQNPIRILELGNTKEKCVPATERASARPRLLRPTPPLGMDPAWRHDDNDFLPLTDRFGAGPMPIQWTPDKGALPAGREKGAG